MSEIQLAAEPGARNAKSSRIYSQSPTGEEATQRRGRDASIRVSVRSLRSQPNCGHHISRLAEFC
jgi:hypothetical protein